VADGIGVQPLLDALDGVAYLVDRPGIIRAVGTASWQRFAVENDVPELTPASVIGHSLFASVDGDAVREACQHLHDLVCLQQRPAISYEYRCDAPGTERRMRMSISPVRRRRGATMALYQSQMMLEAARPPLGLISLGLRSAQSRRSPEAPLLAICSFCHDVAWPIGAPDAEQSWIKVEEYYRRGGTSDVAVSHGICPVCVATIVLAAD